MYNIQKGETLWSIAQKFGTTVHDLVRLNNIENPDLIFPEEVLKIPEATHNPSKFYVVQPSDTLWIIANRHNIPLNDLINMNSIADPNLIFPGQIIRLSY